MKRFLSFVLVMIFLCSSLLSLSSCGGKRHEVCSNGKLTAYVDVDPQSLDAGDIKHCKIFVCHEEGGGEPYLIFPAFISAYEVNRMTYLEIRGASGEGGTGTCFLYDPYEKEWKNAGFWE